MPKYIVRPGQHVTHGDREEAVRHYAKMSPGQTFGAFPPAPLRTFEEGDELELEEHEAAAMPHAVCTPEEFEQLGSPKAFMEKGYTREEAESMAVSIREGMQARAEQRRVAAKRGLVPGGGMAPPDGGEANPRAAGKFPDDAAKKPQK